MQTREGSEWNQAYLEARNKLLNDAGKLASERSQLLRSQCSEVLKKFKLRPRGQQGTAEDRPALRRRRAATRTAPPSRCGCETAGRSKRRPSSNDARAAGDSAAVVYGYIPKKHGRGTEAGHRRLLRRHDHAPGQGNALRRRRASKPARRWRRARSSRSGPAIRSSPTSSTRRRSTSPAATRSAEPLLNQKIQDAANAVPGPALSHYSIRPILGADWHKVYRPGQEVGTAMH